MKNKNIFITGASRGIGLAIAKALSGEYNVYISGRNKEQLAMVCCENGFAGYVAGDLSVENGAEELVKKIDFDIDVLINNAGVYYYSPIENLSTNELTNTINLNILSPYKLTQFAINRMKQKGWGRIINTGSISGVMGEAFATAYSMSKSALIGLTKSLALEVAQDNITVNVINPGWVDTELINNEKLDEDFSKEEILETVPQRRFVKPEEIAALCKYLISEDARTITGQSINICAGLSVGC